MNCEQLIAQSIVCWIQEKITTERDIAREGLPSMDVKHFLIALSKLGTFKQEEFSIALAGYGINSTQLKTLANKSGLRRIFDISDDLHTAAIWRNNRQRHSRIIALARGRHPGVHTLKHFAFPQSRDLAKGLLEWASENETLAINDPQRSLLKALSSSQKLEELRSLEIVADFLDSWFTFKKLDANDAPRKALPYLGLFFDPKLFDKIELIDEAIYKNLESTSFILDASPTTFRQRRAQIEKIKKAETRNELIRIFDKVESLRLNPSQKLRSEITLQQALKIFRLPAEVLKEEESGDKGTEDDPKAEELNSAGVISNAADYLLNNDQDALEAIVASIEESWNRATEDGSDLIEGEIATADGERSFGFKRDSAFLDWVHTFCSEDAWGGLIESKEPSLELALKHHGSSVTESVPICPYTIVKKEGKELSLSDIFQSFDQEMKLDRGAAIGLFDKWKRFIELRSKLLPYIDFLIYYPIPWIPGKTGLFGIIDEYLGLSTEIYKLVQENFSEMSRLSSNYARIVLEGLLALDIVQVKIELSDGRMSHKAVLMPIHPLHLWRYLRLSALIRGLGDRIQDSDRKAILDDVRRVEHFLSVLWLGSIPDGRGADQILPVSGEINGLATFENLKNAVSGIDGAAELSSAIDKFAIISRHHSRPLRVGIVNPPDPGKLISKIVQVLNKRREETLKSLRIELFCTKDHAQRLQAAMRLSEERDLIEEKIASGRLGYKVTELPKSLDELIDELKQRPVHLLAIFDEATIYIRRHSIGLLLPMSPFCIRQQIRYDKIDKEVDLEPTSDEPQFSEYMQLINEAQRGQRDSYPQACADAEGLRRIIDKILIEKPQAAHWVFLADRALPNEGRMQSVKLMQKREGRRQVLLAAADYGRLVELIKPVFGSSNLSLRDEQLHELLHEGVGLIGSGFLDLVRAKDGRPDSNRVRGMAGMLIAARDYRARNPKSLIVAVDNELTRLWLRLRRDSNDRCDLIAVNYDGPHFRIECIEVKTTQDNILNDSSEAISHAQEQIRATLDACNEALPDITGAKDPLSAPRCEMLKEIFVRACQSRAINKELRVHWCQLLLQLFRQEGEALPIVLGGEVISVLLGSNDDSCEYILASKPYEIKARHITESRIQDLIDQSDVPEIPEERHESTKTEPEKASSPAETEATDNGSSPENAVTELPDSFPKKHLPEPSHSTAEEEVVNNCEAIWPPKVNSLGMIGQNDAVEQLTSQVEFSRAARKAFPDKLLVGPAGVGKSSLARAIARQLLNEEEILFNGADLKNGMMIIEKLKERGKIERRSTSGVVKIKNCLIFIDEVHGISTSVATALLSAMDDSRQTSINAINYDFSNVIIILATTDSGKLSEAFNTRPDKTYLKPYTMHEIAAITWIHGKSNLENYELPKEVCFEIAARTRCQPRRAVRILVQSLIPSFYASTHKRNKKISYERIGNALTLEAVSSWFDSQGIDINGLDDIAKNFLTYLQRNGASSEVRLMRGLGISNKSDFQEVDEYLNRLGLVNVTSGGRILTVQGRKYLTKAFDLRDRISRQMRR